MHYHELIESALEEAVNAGEIAGAAALLWRAGEVVQCACVGWRDIEAQLPIERDTLVRIASMTKPITSTAALMLLEEGCFALDDPITRWAPEFAKMRVLPSPTAPLDQTVAAERPITFEDLLTHRSGLGYRDLYPGPIEALYQETLGGSIDTHLSPDEWIAALASLPLIDQPGNAFHYSYSTDLLGFLIARIEDAPLGDVLKRRIFDPLGMKDTGFTVANEKKGRRAPMYTFDETGRLKKRESAPGEPFLLERPEEMSFVSGGAGLWSTLDDYLTFARIFTGKGEVEGVRLLKPETMAMMASNQLSTSQRASAEMMGMNPFTGHGFGLGVAVVMEPEKADVLRCGGGVGAVGWPGAYGTWWQADPNDNSVMIFLAQSMVTPEQMGEGFGLGVYQAITNFQALASA